VVNATPARSRGCPQEADHGLPGVPRSHRAGGQRGDGSARLWDIDDLINEMAIELGRLPRFNAYYKIIEEQEGRQTVLNGKMQTLPLPRETVAKDTDMTTLARLAGHPFCKEREAIEAEIYERQERWRRIEPQTPNTPPEDSPPPTRM
jgi:hypothetical protein